MQNEVVLNNGYKQLIFLLFAYTAVIDSVNGFLMFNYDTPISIGQVYRLLILSIMLIFTVKFNRNFNFSRGILIIYCLIFAQFLYFFYHQSFNGLVIDLTETTRVVLIISIIEAIKSLYKHKKMTLSVIEKIFKFSILLFPLCMVIPWILGVGYSMYVNDVGYSAFFYASNDLNIVLIMMLVYSLDKLFTKIRIKQKFVYYMVTTLLIIVSLLLVGSKASVGFGGIVILYFIFKSIFEKNSTERKMKVLVTTFLALIVSYYLANIYFLDELLSALERHTYFFKKDVVSNNSLTTFVLTGRDGFLNAAIAAFQSSNEVLRMFFGVGYYAHTVETGLFLNRGAVPIEMDIFDVFFSYGVIGTIFIYGYLFSIFFKTRNFRSVIRDYSRYYFGFIVVIIYSSLAGHVIFSALSGGYFALICGALIIIQAQSIEDHKKNKMQVKN